MNVEISDLTRRFGRTQAVAGVTLTTGPGVFGLLGPNGAGKTTLLRMLATVIAPSSGRLRLLGRDPGDYGPRKEVRRRLGYLPQNLGYYPGFTVVEFVEYFALLKEMPPARVHPRLHRPNRDAQQASHLHLRQVKVEPQHQGMALPCRKLPQRPPEQLVFAAKIRLIGLLAALSEQVARLHHRTTKQRPVPVDQDLAGIGRRPVRPPQPPPGRIGPRERLLRQLVGLLPVAGEQQGDPPQRPILVCEEVDEGLFALTLAACHAT
jgi:ABC-type branched-subunit amino acid transport system ATPase component